MDIKNMAPINESFLYEKDTSLEACIIKIAYKDKVAFENLYNETSSAVYGFALSILKNPSDAEDVLQDVFIKIYDNASTYQANGKPLAWILTITKNLSLMKIRKQKDTVDISEMIETLASNESVTNENKIILDAAFELLSDEERNILLLHSTAGFKHREIAKFMNLPLATVLSKYHRSIKKIKNKISKEDIL